MHRLGTIVLTVVAVLVAAAAVWVIADDGGNSSAGSDAAGSDTALPAVSSRTPTAAARRTTPAVAPPTPTAGTRAKRVVAFLGDDWTTGAGTDAQKARFTTLVSTGLGVTERNAGVTGAGYVTAGRGGDTYADEVDEVVAAQPDVVVVSGGRNDFRASKAKLTSATKALFASLHDRLPKATLVAVAPFWGDSDLPKAMTTLATQLRAAVQAVGGTYVDLPDPIHGHSSYMADDADPNAKGYAAIADALQPKLADILT